MKGEAAVRKSTVSTNQWESKHSVTSDGRSNHVLHFTPYS